MARMMTLRCDQQASPVDARGGRQLEGQRGKEVADRSGDLGGMRLQREMAGIEEADDRVRDIPFERLGARRQEERIVLAPYRQERRLTGAKIPLEGRIQRDVALVVAEQVELHLVRAGPG